MWLTVWGQCFQHIEPTRTDLTFSFPSQTHQKGTAQDAVTDPI